MIKLALATLLAVAVYVALGVVLPVSGYTALVVTALGTWGAFTYKGILAMVAFGAVAKGVG